MGNCVGTKSQAALQKINFATVPLFTFAGKIQPVKITDIYDGDTITVGLLLGDTPYRFKLRLAGIDTPEMKPLLTTPNRDLHIQAAICARQFLDAQVGGRIIWVKFEKEEKYGRLMGYLYRSMEDLTEGTTNSINQLMIARGYALAYNGKKKSEFTPAMLAKMVGVDKIRTC